MPDVPILQLNQRWRIATDYQCQWIVQYRASAKGKPEEWRGRKFITSRDVILRDIRELEIDANPDAIHTIQGWPECFTLWLMMATATASEAA